MRFRRCVVLMILLAAGTVSVYAESPNYLVFVSNERWSQIVANNRFNAAPDIVIEVLSPGPDNRRRDLVAKRRLYHKYGVQEYWVVDQESQSVLLYRFIKADEVTFNFSDALMSDLLPGFEMTVESLFKY